jgi:hypothetical protein
MGSYVTNEEKALSPNVQAISQAEAQKAVRQTGMRKRALELKNASTRTPSWRKRS